MTEILRPTSNVTTGGAYNQFSYVDDNITQPSTSGGDGVFAEFTFYSSPQQWGTAAPTPGTIINSATVWLLAKFINANSWIAGIRVRLGGTWHNFGYPSLGLTTSLEWYGITITGLSANSTDSNPVIEITFSGLNDTSISQVEAAYLEIGNSNARVSSLITELGTSLAVVIARISGIVSEVGATNQYTTARVSGVVSEFGSTLAFVMPPIPRVSSIVSELGATSQYTFARVSGVVSEIGATNQYTTARVSGVVSEVGTSLVWVIPRISGIVSEVGATDPFVTKTRISGIVSEVGATVKYPGVAHVTQIVMELGTTVAYAGMDDGAGDRRWYEELFLLPWGTIR